jgi:hypothetical protein
MSEPSDADLLERAVRNSRDQKRTGVEHPRWVAVMHTFALGSTYARALCLRFGFDPDELVKR